MIKSLSACLKELQNMLVSFSTGFVEKEIKKANIPTVDTGENPEVPFPRDMIDLEVSVYLNFQLYYILWV